MTIITALFKRNRSTRLKRQAGFSLVEMMVSVTLSVVVIGSMVSTFLAFANGSKSVGAYTEMSQESRKALEILSRDIRSAADVTVASPTEVVVWFPDNDYYDGESVQYVYDDMVGMFSRVERAKNGDLRSNTALLNGVEQFSFTYFDPLGGTLSYDKASLLLSIKSLQVDAELIRTVARNSASDYIISARFMMRNRPVTR